MPLTVPLPHPQFAEKFQEVKEAARLAREKSQDGEFTSSALALASHQVGISAVCLYCLHSCHIPGAAVCASDVRCLRLTDGFRHVSCVHMCV